MDKLQAPAGERAAEPQHRHVLLRPRVPHQAPLDVPGARRGVAERREHRTAAQRRGGGHGVHGTRALANQAASHAPRLAVARGWTTLTTMSRQPPGTRRPHRRRHRVVLRALRRWCRARTPRASLPPPRARGAPRARWDRTGGRRAGPRRRKSSHIHHTDENGLNIMVCVCVCVCVY
jgi:hypothetical protein